MTIFLLTGSAQVSVNITSITLEIGYQPTWANLQAFQGYFHSNDEGLNKIWYAGAHTLQTDAVPYNGGRFNVKEGWANNYTLGKSQISTTVATSGIYRLSPLVLWLQP